MICQDIMNIIKNNVIMLRNKDKFNEVVKQINRIQHEYTRLFDSDSEPCHIIRIEKQKYDVEFSYNNTNFRSKTITRGNKYYQHYGNWVDNPPVSLLWECSNNLWDYCRYARNNHDINHIKEMEREVINYFNTFKPMERTIKIKKSK